LPARNEKKLLLTFSVILAGTLGMAAFVVWWLWELNSNILLVSKQIDKVVHVGQIKESVLKQSGLMNGYIITGNPRYLEQFRQTARANRQLEDRLIAVVRDSRKPLAVRIRDLNESYNHFCEEKIIPRVQEKQVLPEHLRDNLFWFNEELLQSVSVIEDMRLEDTLAVTGSVVQSSRNVTHLGIIFTVAGLIAGISAGIFTLRKFAGEYALHRTIVATTRNAVVTTDARGKINSFNRVAEEIFEIGREKVLGRHFAGVFTGERTEETIDFTCPVVDEIMAGGKGRCNLEMYHTASDGWEMVLTVDCLPMGDKKQAGILLIARDITARKVMEQRLYELTMRDGLTKLYNHGYLHKALKMELKRSTEQNKPLAFILLDIDNFKYYNDRFGHPAGDELLKKFARVLLNCVRSGDTVGRYGGDEFGIILPDTGPELAESIGERLRRKITEYPFPNREDLPGGSLTASIGISVFPYHGTGVHDLVKTADEAMYHAKRNCKNQVQLYFSSIKEFQRRLCNSEAELMTSLNTLLTLINAKDRYTFAHSEKVAEYAAIIAKELQLPVEQVEDIKKAAFLHDIGKLEIPGRILRKKGALDEWEWQTVKQHPFLGGQMLKSFSQLKSIIPCIVHHHERYDGRGYPHGLAGEEIPLCSRIIAVADSFDAMISERPYKKSLSFGEAILELEKNMGTQFDPAITKVFINAIKGSGFTLFVSNAENRTM